MIIKSETYHFHRLDLTRQAGFVVTICGVAAIASLPPTRLADLHRTCCACGGR